MKTAVVAIIFNRPEKTKILFDSIKKYKPNNLFIISDGPRKKDLSDSNKVKISREVFKNITWKCKVSTNYSNKNLGTKKRIMSGINWVFQNVEEAIFLEDDCIPTKEFFLFVEKMLNKYRTNLKIGSVCGTNLFSLKGKKNEHYFFSKYQDCWGWATWKNRWFTIDKNLKTLHKTKNNKFLRYYLGSYRAHLYWHWKLNKIKQNKFDSWSFIWTYTGFIKKYLHIIPKKNLIKNIGFDKSATNTKKIKYDIKLKDKKSFKFPLIHPPKIITNKIYDKLCEDKIFSKSLKDRLVWLLKFFNFN